MARAVSVGSIETATTPINRLSGIEAGRGVAAVLVVLYHVSRHLDAAFGAPWLKAAFQFGHAGVDFFFVISGFIILFVHYADVGTPGRIIHYAGRRFTRLMPTYWVALALTVALLLAGGHHDLSLSHLAWSASLLPSNQPMVLGIAWTLRFEILFYALFAVLILSRPAGSLVFAIWLSATVGASVASIDSSWLPRQFYDAFALEFFFGMSAAYVLRNYTVPRARLVLATGLALFGLVAALEDFQLLDGYGNVARVAYGIPAAILVLGIAEADRQNRLYVPSVLRRLGTASYSIYIFQFVFIGIIWQGLTVTHLARLIPLPLEFLVLAGATVTCSVLMSVWVEYPLMRLTRGQRRGVRVRPALG